LGRRRFLECWQQLVAATLDGKLYARAEQPSLSIAVLTKEAVISWACLSSSEGFVLQENSDLGTTE
jgi:hypothetical protein